jgi:hypothetical protein
VSCGGEERDVEGGGCREPAIPGLRLALRLALVFGSHQVKYIRLVRQRMMLQEFGSVL